jgi:hypothetical protein
MMNDAMISIEFQRTRARARSHPSGQAHQHGQASVHAVPPLCTSQDHLHHDLHMPIPHTGTAELANIQVHKKYHKKR